MVVMHEVVTSKGVEELDWEEDSSVRKKKSNAGGGGGGVGANNNKKSKNGSGNGANVTPMPTSPSSHTNDKEKKKKASTTEHDALRESYKGNLFLVLEYVSHDLTGLLDMAYKFTEVQAKSVVMQLLGVLEYMHERYDVIEERERERGVCFCLEFVVCLTRFYSMI